MIHHVLPPLQDNTGIHIIHPVRKDSSTPDILKGLWKNVNYPKRKMVRVLDINFMFFILRVICHVQLSAESAHPIVESS